MRWRRAVALWCGLGLAGLGCGSDGSNGAGEANGGPAMTVEALCDPIEDEVAAWAGGSTTAEHNTIYAEAAEPQLTCVWDVDGVDRTIRVDYVGVPDSFFVELVEGKQDRSDLPAPNFHDIDSFWLVAPNGWGIVVRNLGAERSDLLDPMAVIAAAAVAQLPA